MTAAMMGIEFVACLAARAVGVLHATVDAHTPEEYERAFARLSVEKVDGVVLLAASAVIEHANCSAGRCWQAAVRSPTLAPSPYH